MAGKRGFTFVELMITSSVIAISMIGFVMASSRTFNMLRSASDFTAAEQTIQERIEQIRSVGWSVVTCDEIPPSDDDADTSDAADETGDPTTEVLTDTTEFPDDLADANDSEPGLIQVFTKATQSAAPLRNIVEEVVVTKYPEGSTPIRLRRNADGTVTTLSHNSALSNELMVRVTLSLTWSNATDKRTRTLSAQTIITRSTR